MFLQKVFSSCCSRSVLSVKLASFCHLCKIFQPLPFLAIFQQWCYFLWLISRLASGFFFFFCLFVFFLIIFFCVLTFQIYFSGLVLVMLQSVKYGILVFRKLHIVFTVYNDLNMGNFCSDSLYTIFKVDNQFCFFLFSICVISSII